MSVEPNSRKGRARSPAAIWDKPASLIAAANVLFATAFLLALYGALHYIVRMPQFPLREVRVIGKPAHVTADQVAVIVERELKGTFFTLDIVAARRAFEKLPWVRTATVRRQWPDRLEVSLEEHVALARWGAAALVNSQGEVFTAAYDGQLPFFLGPDGAAREMAVQFGFFRRSLAAIGRVPVQVQLSPRRAWQVRLDSGLVIELGRERIEARLERFIELHDRTIGALQRRLEYADLRYPHGFAVRIPELRREQEPRRGSTHKRG